MTYSISFEKNPNAVDIQILNDGIMKEHKIKKNMMTQDYTIELLKDYQEYIPKLAQLWYEEISRHWVPEASIKKAKQKLLTHLNSDDMPMAFVAIHDHQPIGMACLRVNDGIRESVSPWLGSLILLSRGGMQN